MTLRLRRSSRALPVYCISCDDKKFAGVWHASSLQSENSSTSRRQRDELCMPAASAGRYTSGRVHDIDSSSYKLPRLLEPRSLFSTPGHAYRSGSGKRYRVCIRRLYDSSLLRICPRLPCTLFAIPAPLRYGETEDEDMMSR